MFNSKRQMENSISKVNDRSLRIARRDIKRFKEMIERIMKEKRLNSIEETIEYVENRYYNIFFVNRGINFKSGSFSIDEDTTKADYFQLKTNQYLKKYPGKIWDILDKMNSEERIKLLPKEEPFIEYTANMESNCKMFLKEISGYILDSLKIDRKKFIEGDLNYEERTRFQKSVLEITNQFGSQNDKIKLSCIRRITSMAKLLDENGEFEEGTSRYNTIMRKIGLEKLQVEYQKSKKGNKPQFTTMKDLENPKVVEKLPFDSLVGISVFLTNRLAKNFSAYKKAKFILEQKGELKDLYKSKVDISDNELKGILGKFDYLQGITRDVYSETAAKVLQEFHDEDKRVMGSVFSREITINPQDDDGNYKTFFNGLLPNLSNSFSEDLQKYSSSNSIFEGIYERKDFDFHILITSLLDKEPNKINWGYIPEQEETRNSIERNRRMILIGVDFEGFNFPIRLHCSRAELLDLVQNYTGKTEIPVYRGDNDWSVETEYEEKFDMTAQVIAPFDKMKRKFIKQKVQEITPETQNFDYLLHLNWMINPSKVPDKLKNIEIVSLLTGEIKTIDERAFID